MHQGQWCWTNSGSWSSPEWTDWPGCEVKEEWGTSDQTEVSLLTKTSHKLLDWLNDVSVSPKKTDFKITDRTAPSFAHHLLHRSQEHKYPQSTGLFPTVVKTLCSKSNSCHPTLRMTNYSFCRYLPKEHLAVLPREGGTVGRATLLQQSRLVGITSFNIATHLSKCIIHWQYTHPSTTKQHTHTRKCNLVLRTKQQRIQTPSTVPLH